MRYHHIVFDVDGTLLDLSLIHIFGGPGVYHHRNDWNSAGNRPFLWDHRGPGRADYKLGGRYMEERGAYRLRYPERGLYHGCSGVGRMAFRRGSSQNSSGGGAAGRHQIPQLQEGAFPTGTDAGLSLHGVGIKEHGF